MASYKICIVGCSGVGKSSLISQFVSHQFIPDHQATEGSEGYFFRTMVKEQEILIEIEDTKGLDTTDIDVQLAAAVIGDKPEGETSLGNGKKDEQKKVDKEEENENEEGEENENEESDQESVDSDLEGKKAAMFRHVTDSEVFLLGGAKARSGFMVVFDVTRRRTFKLAKDMLESIYERINWNPLESGCPLPILVVGNKVDEKKKRKVTLDEGEALAHEYGQHYAEVSAFLYQNVSEVFVRLVEFVMESEEERELLATSPSDPRKMPARNLVRAERKGLLVKRGHIFKSWKKRYFVLKLGLLYYYSTAEDDAPRGVLRVHDCEVREAIDEDSAKLKGRENVFVISGEKIPQFFIQAKSEEDMQDWISAIGRSEEKPQQEDKPDKSD